MNTRRACLRAIVSFMVLALCPALPAQRKHAQPVAANILRVAAAADLRPVMPVLAQQFEQQTGIKLQVSFASSSALATQIINGAPFDLFLGADFTFPEKVVAANLAAEAAAVPYARGVLVLWAPSTSPIQAPSIDKLLNPSITRIAIADENHAPYGRAAYALLRTMHLLDKLQPKLVVAEDIAQAAQFVQSGNAQVGFISLTLANSAAFRKAGNFTAAPRAYPEIRQCGVVIKGSAHQQQAQQFFDWLLSPKVQDSLPQLGLDPAN
jgi:molybdate transport system substrate-binding protein